MYGPPRYGAWHSWFAWHPANTDEFGWRWMRRLYRRRWWGGGFKGWDYTIPERKGGRL